MSMKTLNKTLKRAAEKRDDFDAGTVIRWLASGTYTYAAIKTPDGMWYTTAQSYNTYVQGRYTWEGLLEVLSKDEVTDVLVSNGWVSAGGRISDNVVSIDLLVRTFKDAWIDADSEGLEGQRTEAGLSAVMTILEDAGAITRMSI